MTVILNVTTKLATSKFYARRESVTFARRSQTGSELNKLDLLKLYRPAIIITFLLSLLLWGGGDMALAQNPIQAEVDRSTLSVDEQLTLRVTVTGETLNIPSPDVSALQDFAVVGSSTSTQVSIINGQMTSQGVYIYRLQPLNTGQLTIPPVTIVIDGQTYQTDPISVEVTSGGQQNLPLPEDFPKAEAPNTLAGQNLFVEAEVDNPTPYLNQQVIYTFRFYQAIDYPLNFRGRLDYRAPSFTDFWSHTVLSQPHYTTTAAGRTYTVTEIRTALFPAGLNTITIEPARLIVPGGLLNPDIVLETEPINIEVQSLPDGAPDNFKGAVGQFELRAFLDKEQGRVNDTLKLIFEIEGAGNINALTEPQLPELPDWRLFESQASTSLDAQEDRVYGARRFERLIVPGKPGDYTIPPISFSYYDPEAKAYRVAQSEPIAVTILPDENAPLDEVVSGSQPVAALGDIRTIKPVPASLNNNLDFSATGRVVYWSCWILPVFIVGAVWIFQTQRQRLMTDTAYARHLRARRLAHKILAEAGHGQVDEYSLVQRALLGYLSDKLNRPTTGLTTAGLVALLEQQQLDVALIDRIKAILSQIEISRFAPIAKDTGQSLVAETKQLINDLEKAFGGKR